MPYVQSLNVGQPRPVGPRGLVNGIDKSPVDGPLRVAAPGETGGGVEGDAVCDPRHHGGPVQAVYAYAREDLDDWQERLGRPLPSGSFGENLTTAGIDVTGAEIGERWRVGADLVL